MTFRPSQMMLAAAALVLFGLLTTGYATDFGNANDVKQIRTVVAKKLGQVVNVSASHDWALCTAYSEKDESDLSVVLHRTGGGWKIKESDGGAFDKNTLKSLGVPAADIATLLKAYQ